jgi:hypothetical protein
MFSYNEEKEIKKLLQNTKDEELKSLIVNHLLKQGDDEVGTDEEQVQETEATNVGEQVENNEKNTEPTVDPLALVEKVKQELTQVYDEKLSKLEEELNQYKENAPKVQSFGAKPKTPKGTDSVTFEDVFMGTRK